MPKQSHEERWRELEKSVTAMLRLGNPPEMSSTVRFSEGLEVSMLASDLAVAFRNGGTISNARDARRLGIWLILQSLGMK